MSQIHGKQVPGIICKTETPDCLMIFTYLPKSFVYMKDALFEKINGDCSEGQRWHVVLYGTTKSGNIGRLLRPNEDVDAELLRKCSAMQKRQADMQLFSHSAKQSKTEENP